MTVIYTVLFETINVKYYLKLHNFNFLYIACDDTIANHMRYYNSSWKHARILSPLYSNWPLDPPSLLLTSQFQFKIHSAFLLKSQIFRGSLLYLLSAIPWVYNRVIYIKDL